MSLKNTLGKILTYGFISTMALSGASSIQSCSPYEKISGKAEIVMVKYSQESNEKIDLVSVKMNNEEKSIYHVKFDEPKNLDSIINIYHLQDIKLRSKNTKRELRKKKEKNKDLEFVSYEAFKLED
jgi:hypothetical protein